MWWHFQYFSETLNGRIWLFSFITKPPWLSIQYRSICTVLRTALTILTYSMVQSPSWEANWFAASQEIPRISRNPKVHYGTHKRPPPVCILARTTSWRSVLILSTYLRLGLPSGLFSLRFPHQDPTHLFSSPIRATCPAHLILLDFVTCTILGEEYKSFSSSLCNLLHSPVTSSLLGPNILLNTVFSNTLSLLSSLNISDQASHPYKTTGKIIVTVLRTALVTFIGGCLYPIYAIHLFVSTTVYSLDYVTWFPENIKYPRSLNFRFIDSAPQQSLVCIFRPHVLSTPDWADVSRPFLTDLVHANCLV